MAIANIFQKLRASAPATAVTALAGFLTLATPFTNATAQEPFKTSHHPQTTNIPQHHQPTILRQAGNYSEENSVVSIVVLKGKGKEGNLTGDSIANGLAGYLNKNGIPAKIFIEPSEADNTAVVYFVKGTLYGPFGLRNAVEGAVVATHDYSQAYGISKVIAPSQSHE